MGTLWTLQSSQPGLSLYSALPLAFGTSYYAISLGTNIIMTALIVLRLLLYRRRLIKRLSADHAKHYVSLASIIVESAALYSLFAFIFLVTYAVNNPVNQIFLGFASFTQVNSQVPRCDSTDNQSLLQQISSYLIIYRLADGRAFKKDTITTTDSLPPMNFSPAKDRSADGTLLSQSLTEPRSTTFTVETERDVEKSKL